MDPLVVFEIAQEEMEEYRAQVQGRHMRVFRDRTNPIEEYTNTEFLKRYRISKDSFLGLLDLLGVTIEHPTKRSRAIPALQQLAIALRFYACGSFQAVVGDTCGVSQPTCCQVVHRVSAAICERKRYFVHFPETLAERMAVIQGFYNVAQFPGVIGAIDGSHVPIVNPGGVNVLRFMNRKGFYSPNCQLVCNHLMMFTNVVSRWYGSAHDSRIFEESRIRGQFQRGERQGILLGDPAYTCTTFMLTPVHNVRNQADARYNQSQRRTRGVIERAFGIWKRRFPCVGKGNCFRCSLDHNMAIIVAKVCLHNLSKQRYDPLPNDFDDVHDVQIYSTTFSIDTGLVRFLQNRSCAC